MAAPGSKVTAKDRVFWGAGIFIVVVYALLPVLWLVSLSLTPADEIGSGSFWPDNPTLENYTGSETGVVNDDQFPSALKNSLGIALIATLLSVVLATFAAYAIVRLEFPGKALVMSGALAIAMFPQVSIIGPLFNMWRDLKLFDTWPGLIIPYMTFTLPLAIWTLSAFFREIPWDLDKAARIDGATPFQAFRKVIAPLAAPGMFTSAILVFIFAWNDFLFATSLTSTNRARTVPAAITFFTGSSPVHVPHGADRGGLGGGHDPDHRDGPHLPAPHRVRADVRRGEGLIQGVAHPWPRSSSTRSPSSTATASRP